MPTPQTTPLAKASRTLEGQLVIVSDVVLAVAAGLPAHIVPAKTAAIIAGVQHIALLIQRGVIKVQASKGVNAVLDSPAPVDAVLHMLDQLEAGQAEFQQQPGVPDHLVTQGLAPDVKPPPVKRSHKAKPPTPPAA